MGGYEGDEVRRFKMENKKPNFLGIGNRRSLLIFTTLLGLGFLWYMPLFMSFVDAEDYSVDFIMTDAAAESGYTKDHWKFQNFEIVLTRYLDVIRIAVITDADGVMCVIDDNEVKQLKEIEENKFFGSIDTSTKDIKVVCNGYIVISKHQDNLKLSKNYMGKWGAIPPMIFY